MKKTIAIALSFALAGCSTTQLQKFTTASQNFRAAVAEVNADIQAVSPILAQDCSDLIQIVNLIGPLVPNSPKVKTAFATGNAALTAYCSAIPTNIQTAITATAQTVAAAQAAYKAAQAGG